MDLTQLLKNHNVPTVDESHHHVTSGWIGVDCPKCSPGWGKFRLGINIRTGSANCWTCGKLNTIEILALICKIPIKKAAAIWYKLPRTIIQKTLQYTGTLEIPTDIEDLGSSHKLYLRKRGFDPEEIEKLWSIKGISQGANLQWRLFIPIFDEFGQPVSWTTRSIGTNHHLRYISAKPDQELVSHKSILYGAHLARHAVVVVEGPLDAWAIGPGAVATCGLGFSKAQITFIVKYPIRIICFDSEKQAQKRAIQLCKNLSMSHGITEHVILESGSDPANVNKEEIQELREKYLEF